MKIIPCKKHDGQNVKGIITKAQAQTAIDAVRQSLPAHKARKINMPETPGFTVCLTELVDLTRVAMKTGAIKSRLALVGPRHAVEEFASAL